jgi:hypothetical protein
VFLIPGSGRYPLQPVFVEDVAELAVEAGHQKADQIIDATGPETYTYEGLVRLIADTVGSRARIVHVPPRVGLGCAKLIGLLVGDMVLTREELDGLMAGLLVSPCLSTGRTPTEQMAQRDGRISGPPVHLGSGPALRLKERTAEATYLDVSFDDVGRMLDVSGETVRRWERGVSRIPTEALATLELADGALDRLVKLFLPQRLPEVVRRKADLFDGGRPLDWILRGRRADMADGYELALTYQG